MSERIELITWHDSYGVGSRWEELDDTEIHPANILSVGYVVKENDVCILVAPHISKHPENNHRDVLGDMVIPKSCILKRETLREGKEAK